MSHSESFNEWRRAECLRGMLMAPFNSLTESDRRTGSFGQVLIFPAGRSWYTDGVRICGPAVFFIPTEPSIDIPALVETYSLGGF